MRRRILTVSERYPWPDRPGLAGRAHERFGFDAVAREWTAAYDQAVTIEPR